MRVVVPLVLALCSGAAAMPGFGVLAAQQVTTATIAGRVVDSNRADVDGAVVRVVNAATGYALRTATRGGRFLLAGLPVGGPYSVTVERAGHRPARSESIFLALGQQLELDFALVVLAALDTLHVVAAEPSARSFARHGIGTAISDSALHRLPAMDRDLYDFVRLVPQVSARSGRAGMSGGGANARFNNFLVDGVSERGLLGNFAAGTGQGAKAISLEAVREYQVLLSPYDVRYGDFAGALVNAVTKSGSNEVHGTAFLYARDERLARGTEFLRGSPYQRAQFGFALGGPIARDRAHFFVAAELQHLTAPARGPYIGQPASSAVALPVSATDVEQFSTLLRDYGVDAGSAGRVEVGNPLVNLFGRIDIMWPARNSRLVLWNNYSRTDNSIFARGSSTSSFTRGDAFQLSSAGYASVVSKEVAAAQLYTHLRNGGLNELLIAFKSQPSQATGRVRATLVSVAVPHAAVSGAMVWLQAGSDEAAHGISVQQRSVEVADHMMVSLGSRHRLAFGARLELLQLSGRGLPGTFGSWEFPSLDALRTGAADRYRLVRDAPDRRPHSAAHVSLYAGDEWRPARLTILAGVRAELLRRAGRRPHDAAVDSLFGRSTRDFDDFLLHVSPRVGAEWDVPGAGHTHVRAGAGVFVGRPPMGWLGAGFRNYGSGTRELRCAADAAPAFVADPRQQPQLCASGAGPSGGPVSLEAMDLRMAENFRASLAVDHMLPGGVLGTVEGLYTRSLSDFMFVNLNLAGAQGSDSHGRVLYGAFAPSGVALPNLVSDVFPEVIELRNHAGNHAAQLALRLERSFSAGFGLSASYAHSHVRDVQTPPDGFQPLENWRRGRVVSGAHESLDDGISALDIPHHVAIAATVTAPWRRWTTDVSFYYTGESGAPFTYIAAAGGRGDLNADGTNLNDPVYVPRSTTDPAELVFSGDPTEVALQQSALEQFIERTSCLRRQRGRIMARNSCRAPWLHTTAASIRQSLPFVQEHTVAVQLDVFNLLNLLNPNWGLLRTPSPAPNPSLLQHVGQTTGTGTMSRPIFRFDPSRTRFDSQNVESAFQLQIALRYSF